MGVNELLAQADELRTKAVEEIKAQRGKVAKAEAQVAKEKAELHRAVRAAMMLGFEREAVSQYAGVSASTIGQWIKDDGISDHAAIEAADGLNEEQ